jgi:predicted nucleic acid-binding protein
MELAAARLFRAKWSEEIHEEWIESLLKDRPDLKREQLERTKQLMNAAVMDALVEGHEQLIAALTLPDPGDQHVLAAAVHCCADAIVTFNLKDFPGKVVSKYNIEVLHPDDFIHHQFGLNHAGVVIAAKTCRERLKAPPKSAEEYLATLGAQGLPKTVAELTEYADLI